MALPRHHQGFRTLSVAFLLAAVLIGASGVDQKRVVKTARLLQDEDAPVTVGVGFDLSIDARSASASSSSAEEELVEALEEDDQVTGTVLVTENSPQKVT